MYTNSTLYQNQSLVAQRAERTVAKCSLTRDMWACFHIHSNTKPGQWQSQPAPTSLGQGCGFRCNLPPALLAEWLGSFTCHCGGTVVEWTPNKSQCTKLTLESRDSLLFRVLDSWSKGCEFESWQKRWENFSSTETNTHIIQISTEIHTHTLLVNAFQNERGSSLIDLCETDCPNLTAMAGKQDRGDTLIF